MMRPIVNTSRLLAVLLLALALSAPAPSAHANGTPIRIVLSYLAGVSNFGPQNATGVAEMITSEGEVRLTAAGLQKLPDNEQYVLWISMGNEQMSLVPVPVGDGGVARVDTVLRNPIPEKAWDLMTLTVEAKGPMPGAPSDRRSIAGRFSMSGSGAIAAPVAGWFGLSSAGVGLLVLLLVGVIGYAVGRAGSRRGTEVGGGDQ